MTLSVYYSAESESYFVAESAEQALEMLLQSGLEDDNDAAAEMPVRLSDDAYLAITSEAEDAHGDGYYSLVKKTHREWCESNGPGYLCSTDW